MQAENHALDRDRCRPADFVALPIWDGGAELSRCIASSPRGVREPVRKSTYRPLPALLAYPSCSCHNVEDHKALYFRAKISQWR